MALADLGDLCHIAGLVEEDADALGVEVIGHGGADRHKDSPRRPAGRPESCAWPPQLAAPPPPATMSYCDGSFSPTGSNGDLSKSTTV